MCAQYVYTVTKKVSWTSFRPGSDLHDCGSYGSLFEANKAIQNMYHSLANEIEEDDAWTQGRLADGRLCLGEDEYEGDDGYEGQRAAEHLLQDPELVGLVMDDLKEDEDMIEAVKDLIKQEQEDDLREEIKEEMKEELEEEIREEIKEEMKEEDIDDIREEVREEVKEGELSALQKEVMDEVKATMTADEKKRLARLAWKQVFDRWIGGCTRTLNAVVELETEEGAKLRADIEKLIVAASTTKAPKPVAVLIASAVATPDAVQNCNDVRVERRKQTDVVRKKAGADAASKCATKPKGVRKRGKRHHDRKSY